MTITVQQTADDPAAVQLVDEHQAAAQPTAPALAAAQESVRTALTPKRRPCVVCGEPLPPRHRSFCGPECRRTQRRRDRRVETTELADAIVRMIRVYGERTGDNDLAALEGFRRMGDAIEVAEQAAVDGLRERAVPWSEIGDALGITRQSAHERFTHGRAS